MSEWFWAKKENLSKVWGIHFRRASGYSFVQFYAKQNGYTVVTYDNPKLQKDREEFLKETGIAQEAQKNTEGEPQEESKPLTYWNRPQYSKRAALPLRHLGYMRTDGECVFDFTQKKDYYMTANGFCDSRNRNSGKVSTLHNLVIDIDCHSGERFSRQDMQFIGDWLFHFLEKESEGNPSFRVPNTIVNTGRGFQLWWALEACSGKKLTYMWKAVTGHYISVLQGMFGRMEELTKKVYDDFCGIMEFNKYDAFPGFLQKKLEHVKWLCHFSVDAASSKKKSGLFRVPGTFNSRAGDFGSFRICHDSPLDLVGLFFDFHPVTGGRYTPFKPRKKGSCWDGFADKREKDLTKLITYRQSRGLTSCGYRDIVCLLLCGAYCSSGESVDAAIGAVKRINRVFDVPMTEKELLAYMGACLHKKYKFGNDYMISVLGITEEEQGLLGIRGTKKAARQAARDKKKQKKEERDALILELHKKGMTQMEIASRTGASQPTVSRIIRCAGSACDGDETLESPAISVTPDAVPDDGDSKEFAPCCPELTVSGPPMDGLAPRRGVYSNLPYIIYSYSIVQRAPLAASLGQAGLVSVMEHSLSPNVPSASAPLPEDAGFTLCCLPAPDALAHGLRPSPCPGIYPVSLHVHCPETGGKGIQAVFQDILNPVPLYGDAGRIVVGLRSTSSLLLFP